MKIFDWISKKPKKNHQAEPVPSSQQNAQNAEIQHHHHNQQATSSLLHAVMQNKLQRLNQSRPAFGLDQSSANKNSTSKRREIVKIFVNHEEYGLLAIGTLGLYDSAGVEPEIELFEVRPNLSLQPDGVKVKHPSSKICQEQEEFEDEQAPQFVEDNKAVVLHSKQQKKHKVFPLDPHIGAASGLFRRSKFLDRLLQPLNYLRPSSYITILPDEEQQHGSLDEISQRKSKSKTAKASLLLKKLLLTGAQAPSSIKQIKCDNNSQTSNAKNRSGNPSKLKRLAMSHFSACIRSPEFGNDEDDDDHHGSDDDGAADREDQKEFAGGASVKAEASSSSDCPAAQAVAEQGDPSRGAHQPTCGEDLKAEYWIRTDSDYVVLEL